MQLRLIHFATTILLLGACGGNDLTVGAVDAASFEAGTSVDLAASPDVAITGGTGGSSVGGAGGNAGSVQPQAGQAGASAAAGTVPCFPLLATAAPTQLGDVLVAGQGADGTIYVLDQVGSTQTGFTQRVFISVGGGFGTGTLDRQRLNDTGTSPDIGLFSTAGPQPVFVLKYEMVLDWGPRAAVLQGKLGTRTDIDISNDKDVERLTILRTSAIAKMPVRNLGFNVNAEYIAQQPDGTRLLVTRPMEEWTYSDFRVFFGPIDAIAERTVASATRLKDGGTTTIVFDVNGSQARATFPVVFVDGGFVRGDATLTVGGVTTPLTLEEVPPDNATYLCR